MEEFPSDREITVRPFTVSGPGGSGKDTSRTGAEARWKIRGLTDAQRERLQKLYPKSVTKSGEFLTVATETRSFVFNAEIARERLQRKVARVFKEPRKRVPTKPKRAARARRMQEKRRHGETKDLRKPIREW